MFSSTGLFLEVFGSLLHVERVQNRPTTSWLVSSICCVLVAIEVHSTSDLLAFSGV